MNYKNFTYGAELEWADIDIRVKPPIELGKFDGKDATLVNSDGHANDPSGKTWNFGGEINTTPSDDIDHQVQAFIKLRDMYNPTINHRCSIHIHIGVNGLKDDLEGLKKLFIYTQANQDDVYAMIPLHEPTEEEYPIKEDFKLAKWYKNQRSYWSKAKVPPNRVIDVLNSTDPKNFYDCHFMWNEKLNRRLYHIGIVRAGINVRALFKYGTVEFRIFPGTTEPEQFRDMFEFAHKYTYAALNDHSITVKDILASKEWNFPEWSPFSCELERGFKATKIKYMDYPDPNAAAKRKKAEAAEKKRLEQEAENN